MADWMMVVLTAVSILVSGGIQALVWVVNIKGAVAANTQAIKSLTDYMDRKDKHDDDQDKQLSNHERRITRIETTHEIKGCVEPRQEVLNGNQG
jgi:hypothetical protein